jgi:hypothetical protein
MSRWSHCNSPRLRLEAEKDACKSNTTPPCKISAALHKAGTSSTALLPYRFLFSVGDDLRWCESCVMSSAAALPPPLTSAALAAAVQQPQVHRTSSPTFPRRHSHLPPPQFDSLAYCDKVCAMRMAWRSLARFMPCDPLGQIIRSGDTAVALAAASAVRSLASSTLSIAMCRIVRSLVALL